jgi:hypothetical protein
LHVVATHPQLLPGIGDTSSQYDVYENFSRAITPNGTPSPELEKTPSEQEILDSVIGRRADGESLAILPPGATAREFLAAATRETLRGTHGADVETLCDAELVDSFYYTRSFRTSIRGARSIASSIASDRTATTPTARSWK